MRLFDKPPLAIGLAAAFLFTASFHAHAAPINLVTNGTFTGTEGQLTVNGSATGWTGGGKEGNFGSQTTPPVFVFGTGKAQTGETGDSFMGTVKFYGVTPSPDGNNFVAADGDPSWKGSISQTIKGLISGDVYTLTFNWAGAQQQGFSGNTTEKWDVSFGGVTQSTATVSTPSQTFVGWQTGSMTFTAGSASQLLSFVANGAPSGEPPWLLLDNVQLVDTTSAATVTPEPSSLVLLGTATLGLAGAVRRRFGRQV